jgi:hypothetical protein
MYSLTAEATLSADPSGGEVVGESDGVEAEDTDVPERPAQGLAARSARRARATGPAVSPGPAGAGASGMPAQGPEAASATVASCAANAAVASASPVPTGATLPARSTEGAGGHRHVPDRDLAAVEVEDGPP